jgi:ABC-2 type transport system permease protein
MNSLSDMIWIEQRKALRSRMPLWTALGSLFMPLGIGFLIFVSRNPDLARKLGLISTKATLMADSMANWPTYLGLFAQMMAAGGFFLFILITSWIFGREFTDGTLKDILAVPVGRGTILLAKFIVAAAWSAALTVVILTAGLVMGVIFNLPQGSGSILLQGSGRAAITACLVFAVTTPIALLASIGRGYLLPIGLAILALIMANLMVVAGWGDTFPWALPGLYAQAKGSLAPVSYWVVFLTGLAGMIGTYLWWKLADQSR